MKITVLGAGKSGVAAANFLAARGDEVTVTDSRKERDLPLAAGLDSRVRTLFGSHPEDLVEGIDLVVLSPGVPTTIPIVQKASALGVPVVAEIELAFRHLRGRVVAITGSNGKSTTTALVGEILTEAGREPVVAGNIGEPLIGAIDGERERTYVVELSSFQLETIETFRADVAVLLNITPDHMDRYATLDDYAGAKYRIFRNQTPDDAAVVNAGDPKTSEPPTPARVSRFSSSHRTVPGAWLENEMLVLEDGGGRREIERAVLAIPGVANVENALAAWLAVDALGVPDDAVERAFRSFRGLPHRMVLVRELDGARYINDSKGTNVDATLKSLEGMDDGCVLLILGGKDKDGEFERLRDLVARKAHAVLTIGSAASTIEEALEGTTTIEPCGDLGAAVRFAHRHARPGDVVLLSPACASFDQYENFEHRGRHFEELVNAL
ncbi:MAG TPA: UDP-N-acetylmuramoyl-L-alanine--D-glutamate ligase [Thermoanaerobaculia bacterium]|nr:UDP-N-acetylmuramoyl-L-alanine--D-glutamate ligase [Thermoanaerobaculia bacterium]